MTHSPHATPKNTPEIQEGVQEDLEGLTPEDIRFLESLWRYIKGQAEPRREASGQEQAEGTR